MEIRLRLPSAIVASWLMAPAAVLVFALLFLPMSSSHAGALSPRPRGPRAAPVDSSVLCAFGTLQPPEGLFPRTIVLPGVIADTILWQVLSTVCADLACDSSRSLMTSRYHCVPAPGGSDQPPTLLMSSVDGATSVLLTFSTRSVSSGALLGQVSAQVFEAPQTFVARPQWHLRTGLGALHDRVVDRREAERLRKQGWSIAGPMTQVRIHTTMHSGQAFHLSNRVVVHDDTHAALRLYCLHTLVSIDGFLSRNDCPDSTTLQQAWARADSLSRCVER